MRDYTCNLLHGGCSTVPVAAGLCAWCGNILGPKRKTWCSEKCGDSFWANHWWSAARQAAKRRDKHRCQRCHIRAPKQPLKTRYSEHEDYLIAMREWRLAKKAFRLEVNHIIPCKGKHHEVTCAHHLDNLETLCSTCHKQHTAQLRQERILVTV